MKLSESIDLLIEAARKNANRLHGDGMSYRDIGLFSGVSHPTVLALVGGKRVSVDSAEKIMAAKVKK